MEKMEKIEKIEKMEKVEKILFEQELNETIVINKLSNGLNCYIIPKAGFVEKQAVVCVNYGSIVDKFRLNGKVVNVIDGTAHFLEHKLFDDEQTSIFEQFNRLGAHVNAFTTYESTAYYTNCLESFDKCLTLLLKFVKTPHFTDASVDAEKGIITQEIEMYNDNPMWQLHANLLKNMFHNCPIKKNIAGTVETIQTINKQSLSSCYDAFYNNENMALICCGDIDKDYVYEIAEKVVKKQGKFEAKVIREVEPDGVLADFEIHQMLISRPLFSLGLKERDFQKGNASIARRTVDTKIMLDVLFGESSAFFNNLYKQGLIDGGFAAEYLNSGNYGVIILSAACENCEKVVDLIKTYLLEISQNGFDEKRFAQILNKHIGRFISNFNSIDSISTSYVDMHAKKINAFDLFASLKSCNSQHLVDCFKRFYFDDSFSLSIVRN